MDLEKLTKHQTVLLALLLSFVTSIATGIVTVTLMDQAPPAITNTINRVVERTIEVIVPDSSNQAASVITRETTVVVTEEDLVTDTIERGIQSLARIEIFSEEEGEFRTSVLGTVISSNGLIVTDPEYVVAGGVYYARLGKDRFDLEVLIQDEDLGVAILGVSSVEGEEVTFESVSFAKTSELKLGQTLISLSGSDRDLVSMGVISGFRYIDVLVNPDEKLVDGEEPETISVLSRIDTDIADSILSGGPNFNVFGESTEDATGSSRASITASVRRTTSTPSLSNTE